jgi:AcrR family transcriptional regulator
MKRKTTTKGDTTRQTIIDSALELFTSKGYHGSSVRDIAEKSGLVVAAIYNHFPDKEAIFVSVLNNWHPLIRILPLLESAENTRVDAFLRSVGLNLLAEFREHPEISSIIFIELLEFNSQHMLNLSENLIPHIQKFAQRVAEAEGKIVEMSPAELFSSLMSAVLAYHISSRLLVNIVPQDENKFMNRFLYGVIKQ